MQTCDYCGQTYTGPGFTLFTPWQVNPFYFDDRDHVYMFLEVRNRAGQLNTP